MSAIPYCMEINDIGKYMRQGATPESTYFRSRDQFGQLRGTRPDSSPQPRGLGIRLHPDDHAAALRIK